MIKKPEKKKPQGDNRKHADRLLQSIGRLLFNKCLVCGGEYSCLHHYWPKSTSTMLRYDLENCVPICAGCHVKHHNGNPGIHETVLHVRGKEWADRLKEKRSDGLGKNYGSLWFKAKVDDLEEVLNKLRQ